MAMPSDNPSRLKAFVGKIENIIIRTLISLMSLLLVLATIELGYTVFRSISFNNGETLFVNLDNILNIFGVFLLVLIGIELLDTIKVYFKKHVIHVEVVLLVAIIAVARKVIVMDFEKYSDLMIIGIAAVIMALAGGYYLIKKTGCDFWPREREEIKDIMVEEKFSDQDNRLLERRRIIRSQSQESPKAPESNDTQKGKPDQPRIIIPGKKED